MPGTEMRMSTLMPKPPGIGPMPTSDVIETSPGSAIFGPPVMPKFLVQWFVYCLLIGFFVAYLAAHTVPFGAKYPAVFRVVGTAAFLAYGLGHVSDGIWKGQTWLMTIKEVIDGLVYGLLTAGTFGWLWPR